MYIVFYAQETIININNITTQVRSALVYEEQLNATEPPVFDTRVCLVSVSGVPTSGLHS